MLKYQTHNSVLKLLNVFMLCIQNKNWLQVLLLTSNHLSDLTEQRKWGSAQNTLWRSKLKPCYAQELRLLYVFSKSNSWAACQASGPLWLWKQGFMSLCIPWRINDCAVSLLVSDLMENVLISVASFLKSEGICECMSFQKGKV